MAVHAPQVFINNYLKEKLVYEDRGSIPFIPSLPTDIDAFTQSFPESDTLFAVYDRMFKLRRSAFPHIKLEQVLYYFYASSDSPDRLYVTQQNIQDLLDRGDESAQEINAWIYDLWVSQGRTTTTGNNIVTGNQETYNTATFDNTAFLLPYFHSTRIFQLEESRDIIDFGTARTWAGNKIIIDYEWHESSPVTLN